MTHCWKLPTFNLIQNLISFYCSLSFLNNVRIITVSKVFFLPFEVYWWFSCIKHHKKDISLKATKFYSKFNNFIQFYQLSIVHCSGEMLCGEWRKPFAPLFFLSFKLQVSDYILQQKHPLPCLTSFKWLR